MEVGASGRARSKDDMNAHRRGSGKVKASSGSVRSPYIKQGARKLLAISRVEVGNLLIP